MRSTSIVLWGAREKGRSTSAHCVWSCGRAECHVRRRRVGVNESGTGRTPRREEVSVSEPGAGRVLGKGAIRGRGAEQPMGSHARGQREGEGSRRKKHK